jgi:hypothetical protein
MGLVVSHMCRIETSLLAIPRYASSRVSRHLLSFTVSEATVKPSPKFHVETAALYCSTNAEREGFMRRRTGIGLYANMKCRHANQMSVEHGTGGGEVLFNFTSSQLQNSFIV